LEKAAMRINSVKDVVDSNLCAGCGVCEAIGGRDRIEMRINLEGFYRPQVHRADAKAWEEIRQVCPGVVVKQDTNLDADRLGRLWGPVQLARVGHSTDETIRWQASSGGALSAILIHLLEMGMVNYVVHVGVSESEPFRPQVRKSHTREQVVENAGSRYAPTAPLVALSELLQDQARFAFVGKPCDIAALRAYAGLNPQVERQVVAYLSFFCAGVPSMLATFDLVQSLGVNQSDVRQFRYRGFGWPGRATAVDHQGQEYSASYQDSWGKVLGPRLQFRCKICPDGVGELTDVVCGDAWQVVEGRPSFEERPGQSVVLARTARGKRLLEQAESAGYLKTTEFDLENLRDIQPSQRNRRRAVAPRLFALWLARRPFPRYQGFYLVKNARDAGLWLSVKAFVGMLRRLARKWL
jgi:coenzyme F420 hydrogenase subunit beta